MECAHLIHVVTECTAEDLECAHLIHVVTECTAEDLECAHLIHVVTECTTGSSVQGHTTKPQITCIQNTQTIRNSCVLVSDREAHIS